ncbi:Uncharacterised protein [Mycobacterium tuberculosis]|nr:Uncharacterised protein [Mycobacterium tuberculosis]
MRGGGSLWCRRCSAALRQAVLPIPAEYQPTGAGGTGGEGGTGGDGKTTDGNPGMGGSPGSAGQPGQPG